MIKSCLIQIFVKDFKESVEWYKEKLGFELLDYSEEWKSATLRGGGVFFDICQPIPKWGSNWMKAKRNIGGLRGIHFNVLDINEAYRKLKRKGVKFLKPPFKTPWGGYKAHFVDFSGNEFSLCQEEK